MQSRESSVPSEALSERRGRAWGLDGLRVGLLLVACAGHGLWVASLFANAGTAELERRDYIVFARVGAELSSPDLYGPRPGGFPFLHPPPVAVLAAPLFQVAPIAVYALIVLANVVALALTLAALARRREPGAPLDVVALATLASAPWLIALTLGQPIAPLVAAWVLGLSLLDRRPVSGGALLGLMALKPTLLIAPLVYLGIQRRWRALGATASTAALLVLLSAPLGLARWAEWLEALARVRGELSGGELLLWKQHTVFAFLQSVAPGAAAEMAWTALAIGFAAVVVWRLRGRPPVLRALAMLALATVTLAPYAYFYDALLLLPALAAPCFAGSRYPRPWRWIVLACAALTLLGQLLFFFALQAEAPALLGLFTAIWLAVELAAPVTELRDLETTDPSGASEDPPVATARDVARSLLRYAGGGRHRSSAPVP